MLTPYRRNLVAVIVTMAGATFSYSFTFPLLSLVLERHGYDSTLIGLNTAVEALSVFAAAPLARSLFRRLGTSGLMLAAIALRLGAFVLLPVFPDPVIWFALRFVMGAGASFMWIVSEAWINEVVEERSRGRVLAAYSMATASGYTLGPLALAQTGTEGLTPFLAGAAILIGSLLATGLAHGHAPRLDGARAAPLPAYFALAPLTMLGCFVVSALDNTLVTFLPLYGPNIGLSGNRALYLLTVMGIGGIVLQYPFGLLADRVDRRRLTLAIVLALCAGSAALPLVIARPIVDIGFMFVFGGLLGALYTMANVLMGERFRGADLAAASTLFAIMWSFGALAGPPAGGLGLDAAPVLGLPAAMALLVVPAIAGAVITLARGRRQPVRVASPSDGP
jgi:MFS family permease